MWITDLFAPAETEILKITFEKKNLKNIVCFIF